MPLNTTENDIRAFVTKRKISGGTVSLKDRDARDIMLGLVKGGAYFFLPVIKALRYLTALGDACQA